MYFAKLAERYPDVAIDLQGYCSKRRISIALQERCAATILRSISFGDGALWSDSLFVGGIIDEKSKVREILDPFSNVRSKLISKHDFLSTLETTELEINPCFQSGLDFELIEWNRERYPWEKINEEDLVLIELSIAMAEFVHENAALDAFLAHISGPVFSEGSSSSSKRQYDLYRIGSMLIDCVSLSMLSNVHPFLAFDKQIQSVGKNYRKICENYITLFEMISPSEFGRYRTRFYLFLRDAAGVSPNILSDKDLLQIANYFNLEYFLSVCEELDLNQGSENSAEAKEDLHYRGYYAAEIIYDLDVSLGSIAIKLRYSNMVARTEAIWPDSCKLLVSLSDRKIEICRTDLTSQIGIGSGQETLDNKLGQCGIWAPNPLWDESVIEHFEYLINSNEIKEHDIQTFFEMYPDFILDDLHIEAFPQVVLFQETGPNLKPDFVVRKMDSRFIDIIELKMPRDLIVVGTERRPQLSHAVSKAVAQLKEYRDWFREGKNRKWFRKKYGLDGYEPRMTLIIGRKPKWADETVITRCTIDQPIKILTYDDIHSAVKRRKSWLI